MAPFIKVITDENMLSLIEIFLNASILSCILTIKLLVKFVDFK